MIIEPNLPLVRGDASLLEQVFFNLFDNATKYAGKSQITKVAAALRGGSIVATVEDDGPGVSSDKLELIFEKFYRAQSEDGRPPGTGLGLAICRGVIEAMDGSIHADSPINQGRGLRIAISLPPTPISDAQATKALES
jgi:two-component system sensor histidine kinase KdpD